MMLRTFVILLCALFISPGAWAVCKLARGNVPTALNIGDRTIKISADAPADTTKSIAEYDSNTLGTPIGYNECDEGTEYGKQAVNLPDQNTSTKIYQTNIDGIGVKLLFNNGSAFGSFPSTSRLSFKNQTKKGTLDINSHSFYRVQFFKTKGHLSLKNPQGDIVLPGGIIGYNYLMNKNQSGYTTTLNSGVIKIISTPACTTSDAIKIDFNTVTPTKLKAQVTRPLNFSIQCQSDYGTYSAMAKIETKTPSSDGSYIRVTDAAGNEDRLGIKITNSIGKLIKVNIPDSEIKDEILSQAPANFTWHATLIPGENPAPAGGTFKANAEIIFNIN